MSERRKPGPKGKVATSPLPRPTEFLYNPNYDPNVSLHESARILDIFLTIEVTFNITFATNISLRTEEKNGNPPNIAFLSEEDIKEKHRNNEENTSAVMKYLKDAGLPIDIAFENPPDKYYLGIRENGVIFIDEEPMRSVATLPADTKTQKEFLSQAASSLFDVIAGNLLLESRKPVNTIPDNERLQVIMDELVRTGIINAEGHKQELELNDFFYNLPKYLMANSIFVERVTGADSELRDQNGIILRRLWRSPQTVVELTLLNACKENFEKAMLEKHGAWFKPNPYQYFGPNSKGVQTVRKVISLDDTLSLYQDYVSGKIGKVFVETPDVDQAINSERGRAGQLVSQAVGRELQKTLGLLQQLPGQPEPEPIDSSIVLSERKIENVQGKNDKKRQFERIRRRMAREEFDEYF